MSPEPIVIERPQQPYVAIRAIVSMQTISEAAARFPAVFAWLAARGLTPAGAPFLKYDSIDMPGRLEIEVGIPVGTSVDGDGEVVSGVLSPGRYASLTVVGPPSDLAAHTRALLDWATDKDLRFDQVRTDGTEQWLCRLEIYNTDPAVEPNPAKWETELAFKLLD
ncbi:GyrI-like domain-containing protein [Actinoallomurus sp. NPDC050550]|uniref:GyrI-like domain-containing protein n=1 Tax=Actinoallomurus sp. NPDC050550 TaxID=3154937 RepID=UPI0033C4EAA5